MIIRNAISDNVKSMLAGDIVPGDAALKIQDDAIRLRSGTMPLEKQEEEFQQLQDSARGSNFSILRTTSGFYCLSGHACGRGKMLAESGENKCEIAMCRRRT